MRVAGARRSCGGWWFAAQAKRQQLDVGFVFCRRAALLRLVVVVCGAYSLRGLRLGVVLVLGQWTG